MKFFFFFLLFYRNTSPQNCYLPKMYSPPGYIQAVDEFVSSWKQIVPMDPLQRMGAVRMRVQTESSINVL